MQFRDLKAQYEHLKKDIDAAMVEVAGSSAYIGGPQVKKLEEDLAAYVGPKYCITCGNGTDALQLAMMGIGIGEGDAVFVPDFTFFASGEIVPLVGGTPIFVDVDGRTFNLDPAALEKKIEEVKAAGKYTPKAVVAVDLFGLPADMPAIRAICDKYELILVEDAAQGFAGRIGDKKACSFGDIATTSFFPAKPLGCYGDGGAVFTSNDEWAALINSYKVHGKGVDKYDNVRIGVNSRLDTMQAAILQIKFDALKEYELDDVNAAAAYYTEKLQDVVVTPLIPEGFYSSWAQYTIQLPDNETREGLKAFLQDKGIPSMIYYLKPMHLQGAFDKAMYDDADYPETNRLSATVLSLPIHPYLTREDADEVIAAVKEYLSK